MPTWVGWGHFGWRIWQEGNRPSMEQYAVWLGGLALSLTATLFLGNVAVRLLREARARAEAEQRPITRPLAEPAGKSVR